MKKLNRNIMWAVLTAIALLAVLSVSGAFYGADKAKLLFNSVPLGVFWYGSAVLLIVGFVEFPRLLKRPGLFIIHAGCLLVLGGSMWGSQAGHRLQQRLSGTRKIPNGYMLIYEGDTQKDVMTEDFNRLLGQLPFSIRLKDFRLEYYPADKETVPTLYIQTQQGRQLQLIARSGEQISLGKGGGRLKVVRTFTNFKIRIENGQKIVTDDVGEGENPAVEVRIERPDANSYTRFVFERFAGFNPVEDGLQLRYVSQKPRMIRDYFSDISVIENGKETIGKTIEVNHPLHYGGYHFYQHSYDSQAGEYTVLSITSDSGLYAVYAGYWLLGLGVLWRFWFRHIVEFIKGKKYK